MKNILSFFTVILFCFQIYGADTEAGGELNIRILNNPWNINQRHEVFIEMELVSLCWDGTSTDYNLHNITDDFPGKSKEATYTDLAEFEAGWYGIIEDFALGNYKVTAIIDDEVIAHFFIDYRTSSLPESFNDESGGDVKIDFNINNSNLEQSKFYYNSTDVTSQQLAIWNLKPWITNIKTELEPFPPDNFQLTSPGINPHLEWSPSENQGDYVTGYAVYRKLVKPVGGQTVYTKIASLNSSTFEFTDYEYAVGGNWTAYYKIAAVNGEREIFNSTILNTAIGAYKIGTDKSGLLLFSLSQNFPNPFNPSTLIHYSIPDNAHVKLTIYNIQGEEIKELINEFKESGNYTVEFNSENASASLPSGIYFYRMQAETSGGKNVKFMETKSFILLR